MKTVLTLMLVLSGLNAMALSEAEKNKLDLYLEGKRIVFLGEPDHWIKDKTEYQKEYLKYLISKGFNFIGNERGYIDSTYINEYIQTGDKELLNKCGECGYRGPEWPKRAMRGVLSVPEEFEALYAGGMQKNDIGFLKFLRKQRLKNDFTYLGYDVDKIPDIIFDELKPFVATLEGASGSDLKDFARLLKRSPIGDFVHEVSNLKQASINLKTIELNSIFKEHQIQKFINLIKQLEDSVKFAAVLFNDSKRESLMEAYEEREKTMFRIVDDILTSPDAKIVLLGHNAHLAKDHMEYRRIYEHEGEKSETQSWLTLGSYLHRNYKEEVLAIWMLYNTGFHSAPFCAVEFPCPVNSIDETLEAWLARNHNDGLYESSFLMDITDLTKIIWRENSNILVTGELLDAVDLIYFKNRVSGF